MPRIAGVDLPRNKRVEIGLTYIYGIGRSRSNEILDETGVNPDTRDKDLTETETSRLREFIERNYHVEIVAACPCAASAPGRTPVRARGRARQCQVAAADAGGRKDKREAIWCTSSLEIPGAWLRLFLWDRKDDKSRR